MSVVITLDDIQAYAEVDYIINHMNEKYIKMLPKKLKDFFANYKDPTYNIKINPYVPLTKQGLKKYTLEIIAVLHLKYWCEDEERKKRLYEIMVANQEKIEKKISQEYNIDNIFQNDFSDDEENENTENFSQPRVIQKYEIYKEKNDDIQDYTDLEEVNQDKDDVNKQEELVNKSSEKKNFLQFIKEKILSIFRK